MSWDDEDEPEPEAGGDGASSVDGPLTKPVYCPACYGFGAVFLRPEAGVDPQAEVKVERCPLCGGSGEVDSKVEIAWMMRRPGAQWHA